MITIGVKLDPITLSSASPLNRGLIFAVGVVASNVAMFLVLVGAAILHYPIIGLVIGGLVEIASVASELLGSTKVGDLSKMRREFAKRAYRNVVCSFE